MRCSICGAVVPVKAALAQAGQLYDTNVEAAAKCGVTVDAYGRQCTRRGIETAAERVRREREEEKSRRRKGKR